VLRYRWGASEQTHRRQYRWNAAGSHREKRTSNTGGGHPSRHTVVNTGGMQRANTGGKEHLIQVGASEQTHCREYRWDEASYKLTPVQSRDFNVGRDVGLERVAGGAYLR